MDVDRQDEGKSAPCVFDSMWAFQPVRFRARLSWWSAPTPTSPVSLFPSLFITLSLYHNYTLSRIHLLPSSAHVTVQPGTPCEPPWIRDVTLLFCSLLFLPFSLLTLATERRVLVCSCCFFDTFTPAPRFAAEEWGLEVKQVWLTSWNRRGWRSS